MKTETEPNEYIVKLNEKLRENFSEVEITALLMDAVGSSEVAHKFIFEEVQDFVDIPTTVKYSMVQTVNMYMLFHSIFHDKLDDEIKFKYMPVRPKEVLPSEEDYEKRFIQVVKMFYKQLKNEGKL